MKRIPAGAIEANIKKSHEESIRSGQWFHGSVSFDPCRYLDDKYKGQVTKLFELLRLNTGYKTDQKLKDFEVLLANLLHQTRKPISISLNKNDWNLTKYNKTSYFTVQAIVPKLFEQNLIGMKKGYSVEEDSRMTRIWA
ncbi:MAG: hypothetical protein IH594_12820, partial [Bacteroidales bacterium]|nr:hypothetical protein [Bacteroidales bacterium]